MADANPKTGTGLSVRPEDEIGSIADRCLQRTVVRGGAGVAFGMVAGTLLMRRGWGGRGLLTMLAAGIGIGSAYSDCQVDLREAEAKGKRFPRLRDVALSTSPSPSHSK